VEGDYIGYPRVVGHADMLTDTAVTVDASSDRPPMIGAGPESTIMAVHDGDHWSLDALDGTG
jgi:hypothetical protein